MKLYFNDASPYARIVRVLLIETGLDKRTELEFVDPWNADDTLLEANPVSKVPALELSDGTALVESGCIADYLIHHAERHSLAPAWHADAHKRLEMLGLARGVMDCAFGAVIQTRFAPESPLIERWRTAIPRIAARLDRLLASRGDTEIADYAGLSVGVAMEYVDFRLGKIDWRGENPNLAAHVAVMAKRKSLQTTRSA